MVFKRKSKKKSGKRAKKNSKKSGKRKQFKGKRKSKTKNMAKKGGFRRATSKVSNSLKSGMLGDAIKGAGAQSLSHEVTDRLPVSPTVKTAVAVGAAYMAGGPVGAAVAAVKEGLIGQFGGMGGGDSGDAI